MGGRLCMVQWWRFMLISDSRAGRNHSAERHADLILLAGVRATSNS